MHGGREGKEEENGARSKGEKGEKEEKCASQKYTHSPVDKILEFLQRFHFLFTFILHNTVDIKHSYDPVPRIHQKVAGKAKKKSRDNYNIQSQKKYFTPASPGKLDAFDGIASEFDCAEERERVGCVEDKKFALGASSHYPLTSTIK